MAGAPVVALFLNGIVLFFVQHPWLRPRWQHASVNTVKVMMRVGALFFVLSVAFQLTYTPDNLIVLHYLDEKAVADYSVAAKVFSVAPLVTDMFLIPLWPAYGEAAMRGDVAWIKRTLARSVKASLLFAGVLAVILVSFGVPILAWWTKGLAHPTLSLLLGFGCWSLLTAWGNAVATFLNGVSKLKVKVVVAIVLAVVALGSKLIAGRFFGLPGIIWGMVISFAVCVVIPFSIYVPHLLGTMARASQTRPMAENESERLRRDWLD
jgi:O-antigen/teichoic acid export membrane protein